MREIDVKLITEKVKDLCMKANTDLGEDVLQAFDRAMAGGGVSPGRRDIEGTEGECPDCKRGECPHLPGYGFCSRFCRIGAGGSSGGGRPERSHL